MMKTLVLLLSLIGFTAAAQSPTGSGAAPTSSDNSIHQDAGDRAPAAKKKKKKSKKKKKASKNY
jgi:hypothetical protein